MSLLSFLGCSHSYPPLETVANVDLNRYLGKWYEIALFPNSFEKGCNCTTAEYSIEGDYIRVVNSCRRDSIKAAPDVARGKAFVVNGSNNSKLRVQFFWPFRGDYWIIDLADDYTYAVVGSPNREYLWILSRTPKIDPKLYENIVKRAEKKGFDISKLKLTEQECVDSN